MFEIIKSETKFDFTSKFKITSLVSLILVAVSLFGIFKYMKYGVDFRGGAEVQVKFDQSIKLANLRAALKKGGFSGITAQSLGDVEANEYLIKVQGNDEKLNQITEDVNAILRTTFASKGVDVRKVDIVGPKAGAELRKSGFLAMVYALLAIMLYIALRFDFKYSPGAIGALFHDVTIILGIFAFTGSEFTLQTVAALLAVIGYSVNDTVIVYDRVRENERKFPDLPIVKCINNAVNETLSRTILTSGTTLFISVTMYYFGGVAIRDFFMAISLGVLIGTYSSISVAAPITILFDSFKKDPAKDQVPANA